MAWDPAIIYRMIFCLLPSWLDGIVLIMWLEKMAAGTLEMANDFEVGSNFFCKDCIAGVIHPKVKLHIILEV